MCFVNVPRLTKDERNRLVGILQGGASVATVARHFNVTRRTVYETRDREITTGSQNDRPRRIGRMKTTVREDNLISQPHQRNRFKSAGQTRDELNNIRSLRDLLDRHIRGRQNKHQVLPQLEQALHEEWNNIPQVTVQSLINSMRRRCQAVIDA